MEKNDKEHDVVGASQLRYAIHLTKIYNWLFPPLLDKALNFYMWFFTEREPESILSLESLEYVLSKMDQEKPCDIDSLVEFVQRQTIPDGIVVREAIRFQLNRLETQNGIVRITKNGAPAILKDCMMAFAESLQPSQGKNCGDETTTETPQ